MQLVLESRLVTFPQALPYFLYDHNHLRMSKQGKGNPVMLPGRISGLPMAIMNDDTMCDFCCSVQLLLFHKLHYHIRRIDMVLGWFIPCN